LKHVYKFGLLEIRKSYSKEAYGVSHRNLKLTSVVKNISTLYKLCFVPKIKYQIMI